MATTADNAANRQPYHLANSFITSSEGTTLTIRTRCLLLTPLKPSEHVPNTIHNHITTGFAVLYCVVFWADYHSQVALELRSRGQSAIQSHIQSYRHGAQQGELVQRNRNNNNSHSMQNKSPFPFGFAFILLMMRFTYSTYLSLAPCLCMCPPPSDIFFQCLYS